MGDTIAFFGNTGEGKTFLAYLTALIEKARGRPVYMNFHAQGINCTKILRGRPPSEYPPSRYYLSGPDQLINMTRYSTFERNSLVILDEAYAWGLDARETMAGDTASRKGRLALTHSILQSRKAHYQIEHTEQLVRSVDNRLRFLTEIYVMMKSVSYRIIDGEKINTEFMLMPLLNQGIWGIKPLPRLYIREPVFWYFNRFYDTYEQISLETQNLEDQAAKEGVKFHKESIPVPEDNLDQ